MDEERHLPVDIEAARDMNGCPSHTMRIVLIGYIHGHGGIQTHTRYLAEGLRERGHAVSVISPPPIVAHGHYYEAESALVYRGLLQLIAMIRACDPHVAVVTGTGWKSMLGVILSGSRCRKVFFEVMSGARLNWADPRMLSHVWFDSVVGQGAPVTRRFIEEFGWSGPAETIPALPEPLERQFRIPPRILRRISSGIRYAYFGRLAPSKNARLLIERFGDFSDDESTLDIWGTGSDAGPLAALIEKRDLMDRINLRGRYPGGQAYVNMLQKYDLLLLPTIAEEGAPLVLLEAMACGLPFVANGMGGIPDYDNADCMITNGDIASFIPAVNAMTARLKQGEVDPQRIQAHYAQHFSFTQLVSRWETFLYRLCGDRLMPQSAEKSPLPTGQ